MKGFKKAVLMVLVLCCCLGALGCDSTLDQIDETDRWMKDNLW